MSMDELLASDAAALFADTSMAFEVESVEYKQDGVDDPPTVSVQAFRDQPWTDAKTGAVLVKTLIFLPRGDITAVYVGRDTVGLSIKRGGTAVSHRVTAIQSEDAGGWMLVLN